MVWINLMAYQPYLIPNPLYADSTDDIALDDIANTPVQAESQLQSLERAASGIGLYVNAGKTEYMCFNQRGNISTLKGGPLKPVNNFTYLGSNASSTENDINIRLANERTAIDMLLII